MQMALFQLTNPLASRVGESFFSALPRSPGVYLMRSAAGEVLYVGKAKDLRARLRSYKTARANLVSRKVMRLLRLVHRIEIRLCETEKDALLTENRLLRELRPPFNVLNTHPENYHYLTIARATCQPPAPGVEWLEFSLTTAPDTDSTPDRCRVRVFGVFKSRRMVREAYVALLRLFSAHQCAEPGFYFPTPLTRPRPPSRYVAGVPAELVAPLHEFLAGRSPRLLSELVAKLLENAAIPKFIHHVITEDLKILEEFYRFGPSRIRKLKRAFGIRRRAIAQDEIDDLLVRWRS